jgi:hypothetical protein
MARHGGSSPLCCATRLDQLRPACCSLSVGLRQQEGRHVRPRAFAVLAIIAVPVTGNRMLSLASTRSDQETDLSGLSAGGRRIRTIGPSRGRVAAARPDSGVSEWWSDHAEQCERSTPRVELNQRARDTRLGLERIEHWLCAHRTDAPSLGKAFISSARSYAVIYRERAPHNPISGVAEPSTALPCAQTIRDLETCAAIRLGRLHP